MFGLLLLLLLSRFSRVRLCATPKTTAHQAPPSLGFSRQEHGVGCHFLLQWMKMKSESQVAQSCPTLCEPMDCSLPGSFVHGIFQARVLEWGAIAYSAVQFHAFWQVYNVSIPYYIVKQFHLPKNLLCSIYLVFLPSLSLSPLAPVVFLPFP